MSREGGDAVEDPSDEVLEVGGGEGGHWRRKFKVGYEGGEGFEKDRIVVPGGAFEVNEAERVGDCGDGVCVIAPPIDVGVLWGPWESFSVRGVGVVCVVTA